MKTIIINNNSKHIKELASLFSDVVILDKKNLTQDFDINGYDLLILSGGSNVPTVLRHPEEYTFEIELVRKNSIPILGICLGTEIICEAYGGKLQELSEKHRGSIKLKIEDIKLKLQLGKDELEVVEGHQIGVKTLPENFVSCALSEHGIEILKHKDKLIVGFQFHPEISDNKKLLDWAFETLKITNQSSVLFFEG